MVACAPDGLDEVASPNRCYIDENQLVEAWSEGDPRVVFVEEGDDSVTVIRNQKD